MTATLPQATKLLQLAAGMTNERLQSHLETGLLADLLAVTDPWVVDRKAFQKFLASEQAKRAVSGIREIGSFTLKPYKGKSDLKQLVKSGAYDWTNSEITPDRFTAKVIGPLDDEVECVLVQSDKYQASEEMLAWAKQNNCERPTAGDALRFGIEHPEEQRKYPLVFLHEPVQGSYGHPSVLVLRESVVGRSLSLGWFGDGWDSVCVFVFVRKRKKA